MSLQHFHQRSARSRGTGLCPPWQTSRRQESPIIDIAPQHFEASIRRGVKDRNVMLLENVAHVRLGEIDYGCSSLAELLRRRGKMPSVVLAHRQWAHEHQEAIVGSVGSKGFANRGKESWAPRCA